LGSCHPEEGAVQWPWHRADSSGNGAWAISRMEEHPGLKPYLQKLLDLVKLPSTIRRHTKHHWELANRRTTRAEIVLPQTKMNEVVAEHHGGSLEGHLGVNKTSNKVTH
jgi:hypothetical protein